jgi:hypothetical protein
VAQGVGPEFKSPVFLGGRKRNYYNINVCIYVYEESIMKPTKHCLKKQGKKGVRGVGI